MPQLFANLTKNATDSFVAGGALWPDTVNKYLYQYGGEAVRDLRSSNDGIAIYDILLDRWNHTRLPWRLEQVAWGASAVSNERGEGYYFGGWVNNRTEPGTVGEHTASGLIRFDMESGDMLNLTGPDPNGRAEGFMTFLPASDAGLLIYFGGIVDPWRNGSTVGAPMSTIHIYDIASSKWYVQNATGEVPEMRRRFCAGATWADDHSSYNIYLYGGLGVAPDGVGFDDVYILSLPSFTWIKWWKADPAPGNPHHSMTCNVINRSQVW
jgi:hypothetical protein